MIVFCQLDAYATLQTACLVAIFGDNDEMSIKRILNLELKRHSIWRRYCAAFLALLLFGLSAAPIVAVDRAPTPVLLSTTPEALTVYWTSPHLDAVQKNGLALPGWMIDDASGLPFATTLVVLPPTGAVTLSVRVLDVTTQTMQNPLILGTTSLGASPAVPLWELPELPPAGVTLIEIGRMDGVRLAQLTYVPFAYDPVALRLTQLHAVEATLHFADPLRVVGPVAPLHTALRPLLLNPRALHGYPQPARIAGAEASAASALAVPTAQFRVETRGVYALTWSTLQAAGIVTDAADPARVHVHRPSTGAEVALYWDAATQRFLFYADPKPTRWAVDEIYRASYDDVPGLRMASYAAKAATLPAGVPWTQVLVEEQRTYESLYRSPRNGDHWYWRCLERPASAACTTSADFVLPLDSPLSAGLPATLTVWMHGYTNPPGAPNHRVAVSVNGASVGEVTWSGRTPKVAQFTFPAAELLAGNNTAHLELPGIDGVAIEGTWVDALALRYPIAATTATSVHFTGEAEPRQYALGGLPADALVLDVTDPDAPVRLPAGFPLLEDRPGPREYFALHPNAVQTLTAWSPLETLAEPDGADYLALAPASLLPALEPLLAFHETRGLTTFAAPTEALYDLYGDGRMDPRALRAFVAHAYAAWTPRPRYLLLAGDGTWDPLDHLGTGSPTLLPPYLVYADPWMGEIPADNRYVAVDGDDLLPDLAVGRLPVNSPAELTAVIDKLIAYSLEPVPGDWNTRHLFVADDADSAGDFPAESDQVAALVPITHTVTRLYCTDDPANPTACANLPDVRNGLLQGWNQGALVINWVGHSAFQQWEHGRLFHTDDLPYLARTVRYPLVLSMSCFTGHFTHPDPNMTSMDEALLRLPEAGAIATFGNAGLGLGKSHTPLHRAFYQSALGATPTPPGVAANIAKVAIAGGVGRHLVDGFHFFGDPALPLHSEVVPWPAQIYLPLVTRGY